MQAKQNLKGPNLLCPDHNSNCQFLNITKDSCQNRLLCPECLDYDQNTTKWQTSFQELLPLSIAFNSPESLINALLKNNDSKFLKPVLNLCILDLEKMFKEELENLKISFKYEINKFESQVDQIISQIVEYQNELKQERETFLSAIKYKEFQELIMELQAFEEQKIKDDSFSQVRRKLSATIDEMVKDNCSLIKTSFTNSFFKGEGTKQINIKIKYLWSSLESISSSASGLFNTFLENIYICPTSEILDKQQFCKLQRQIEYNSSVININLIYSEVNEKQNFYLLKNSIIGQNNLLFVFKTEDYKIFGGYIPCLWKNNKVADYQKYYKLYGNSFFFDLAESKIHHSNSKNVRAIEVYFDVIKFGGGSIRISDQFSFQGNESNNQTNYDPFNYQKYIGVKIISCEVFELKFS